MLVEAADYLWNAAKYPVERVCAVFGKESFFRSYAVKHIRQQTLPDSDAEFSLNQFDGTTAGFREVVQNLTTSAMFGGGQRLVIVDDADKFVTKYRMELEKYAENPSKSGILVLVLDSFPGNTNLYKKISAAGLLIDCAPLDEKKNQVASWIVQWARYRYKLPCEPDAAGMIADRIGCELGLIDQELAKLSLTADLKRGITFQFVQENVGAWRSRTVFEMLDYALDGKTAEAVRLLDNLIRAGEAPQRILAGIAGNLRIMAAATQIILDGEKEGRKTSVKEALEKAGMNGKKAWLLKPEKGKRYSKPEQQLIHLGRNRGSKLFDMLLKIDLDMKGNSRSDTQVLLETFLVKIARPLQSQGKVIIS